MKRFGLIGYPLSHSFSAGYFAEKFVREKIDGAVYENFPLENIALFADLLKKYPDLCGLNVTIPYKEQIIPYLDDLDSTARAVGAVNTIRFERNGNNKTILVGYNTDVYGFETSIEPFLGIHHRKALILGTGGASKAVNYVLKNRGIHCEYISRKVSEGIRSYGDLTVENIREYTIIINCTPLGMHPNIGECPPIPYRGITSKHVLYDLIYNPSETFFLAQGKALGAQTINGLGMLHQQAEKAWEIWNR